MVSVCPAMYQLCVSAKSNCASDNRVHPLLNITPNSQAIASAAGAAPAHVSVCSVVNSMAGAEYKGLSYVCLHSFRALKLTCGV